jgi:hypothetical protein
MLDGIAAVAHRPYLLSAPPICADQTKCLNVNVYVNVRQLANKLGEVKK